MEQNQVTRSQWITKTLKYKPLLLLFLFLFPITTIASDYDRVIGRVVSVADSSYIKTLWTDTINNIEGKQLIICRSSEVVVLRATANLNAGDTIIVRDIDLNEGAVYGMLVKPNGDKYIAPDIYGYKFKVFPAAGDGKWL